MEAHPINSHRILRNRPRSAAVIAGVLLALATANLLMALAGGLGLWTFGIFNLEGMHNISLGLGVWTIAAWTIAGFVGGLVAVTVSGSFIRARCLCLRFGDLGCHVHNGSCSYVDVADGLRGVRHGIKRHGQQYRQ